MRPKVVFTSLALAIVILVPAIAFHVFSFSPPPAPAPSDEAAQATPAPLPKIIPAQLQPSQPPAQDGRASLSSPDHTAYVVARASELGDLAVTGQPDALRIILSELENPDAKIRKSALIAAVDFGSREAIPALQNEMELTQDLQEKVDLQKAISFLQLPPSQPNGPQGE